MHTVYIAIFECAKGWCVYVGMTCQPLHIRAGKDGKRYFKQNRFFRELTAQNSDFKLVEHIGICSFAEKQDARQKEREVIRQIISSPFCMNANC